MAREASPYVAVARIRVAAQPAWSEARAAEADDRLSFTPWHGLAAHRSLGSINRARKPAYAAISAYRAEHNGVAIREPDAAVALSGAPANAFGTTRGREGFRNAVRRAQQSGGTRGVGPMAAGAIGGLAGGVLVSALMLGKEALTGEPSDLVQLDRKLARGPDALHIAAPASPREQARAHGGHLALSAASGALYGALKPKGASPVPSGLALGAVFLGLAYGLIGPSAGLTLPPWRDTTANNVQHVLIRALFGVTAAIVADRVASPPRDTRALHPRPSFSNPNPRTLAQ